MAVFLLIPNPGPSLLKQCVAMGTWHMIISEDIEANLFCINSTMEYMDESNHRFAIAIRNVIDDNPIDVRDIKGNYLVSCNPVICFNRKNIFSNKN